MSRVKTNDIIDNHYIVMMVCETKHTGIALCYSISQEDNIEDWATYKYSCIIDSEGILNKGLSQKEAYLEVFNYTPLVYGKYDIYSEVNNMFLRDEAESRIAEYIYKTQDISYKQVKKLQKIFDVEEVIRNYENINKTKDWNKAIEEYMTKYNIKL